jgi:sialate O-acetylesterase
LKDKGGESLYGSAYKQVVAAGGKIRGVLWYQGESDASPEAEKVYKEKMKGLIAALRADAGVPDLPFYYVQIGRFVIGNNDGRGWNAIQNDELQLEADLGVCGMVPAVDLALDDLIHVSTASHKTLGYRLANLAEHDLFGGKVLRGPRPVKIERAASPYGQQLRVTFDQVNGGLQSAGRASGFSVSSGPNQDNFPCILKAEIAADNPNVVVLWVQNLPDDANLWYGRTLDPYCNIVDQANMAVPVFGPMPVPK